jgi:hypothetical protein
MSTDYYSTLVQALRPVHLDYSARSCAFWHKNRSVLLRATFEKRERYPELSGIQVSRVLRQPSCHAFLAFIKPTAPDIASTATTDKFRTVAEPLRDLVREFADVFPDKLPYGIPPDRGDAHAIDLEPGAKPPFRPIYHQSPVELTEVKKQIAELLEAKTHPALQEPVRCPHIVREEEGRHAAHVRGLPGP